MKSNYEANIFIRNIPRDVDDATFKEEMSKAGTIKSIKLEDFVSKDRATGEEFVKFKKGYVCYEDVKQAQKCIQMYHQSNPFGFGKTPLYVDFWQSKYD